MSKPLVRAHSLRKPPIPIIDEDDDDEPQRRDSLGRKRVEVVQCLLDTSSDEIDNENIPVEKPGNILWLTFQEICHIRTVLAQESLSFDKQSSQLRNGRICFRCRRDIFELFFLPEFLRFKNHEVCFICQQTICTKCACVNFIPPARRLSMPMRIQNLIKSSSAPSSSTSLTRNSNEKNNNNNKPNTQARPICYDCLQIFNENLHIPQRPVVKVSSPFRRTYSLPPMSSKTSTETRYTRHRRRPQQISNGKIENNNQLSKTFR